MTTQPSPPSSAAQDDIGRVQVAIDQIRALLGQLDALSLRQSELIAADDNDRLLSLLSQRQVLVDELVGHSRLIGPLTGNWDAHTQHLDDQQRDELRKGLAAIERMARTIELRDVADQETLGRKRSVVSEELASMSKAKAAMTAYGSPAAPAPKFQDREG